MKNNYPPAAEVEALAAVTVAWVLPQLVYPQGAGFVDQAVPREQKSLELELHQVSSQEQAAAGS